MATVAIILYKSKTLKDGTHPIALRVTKDRRRKYIMLGYYCIPDQWDENRNEFKKSFPNYKQRNRALFKKLCQAEDILDELEEDMLDYTLENFRERLVGIKPQDIYPFIEERIAQLKKEERFGYADSHRDTRNALKSFHSNKLMFSQITPLFLTKFEKHLKNKPCKNTTIGIFMRTLRAIINQAIKEKRCKQKFYPFNEYKISKLKTKTKPRALKHEDVLKIAGYVPTPNTRQELSKDMFMFSFYNMGMNYKDVALLEWTNIEKGRINYERSKTGQSLSIKILPPVQEILDKYKSKSKYVFPIIEKRHNSPGAIYKRLNTGLKTYNKHLKIIASQMGIEELVTSYVARHSWATVLKKKGVDRTYISEMMGHSSEKVTQAYLDSFENETLDAANESLLD